MDGNKILEKFFADQLSVWPQVAAAYRSLKTCRSRGIKVNGLEVRVQNNPGRVRSTASKVDAASVSRRPCFLCAANRPKEQRSLHFDGRKGREYQILVNPYPIFPTHLVIARDCHVEQTIWHHFVDMADLAHHYTDYTVFYNGPRSGASAPDHFHFQAAPRHLLPLEAEADRLLGRIASLPSDEGVPNGEEAAEVPEEIAGDMEYIASVQEAQLFHYKHFTKGIFFLRARTSKSLAKLFYRVLDCAPLQEGETEPMFNALVWYSPTSISAKGRPSGHSHGLFDYEYRAVVILRGSHRSHHYFSTGEDHLTLSPGCADMAGLFIMPSAKDYDKLTPALLEEVLSEVSISGQGEEEVIWRLTRSQPQVQVGILSADEIVFEIISDGAGPQKVSYREGKIDYNGALYDELYFEAPTISTLFAGPTFILHNVVIGIGFHWERKVNEKFAGALKFIVDKGKVVAVNLIGVEDYLLSVISSEMRASAPPEFLRAHAVISRSWLMVRMERRCAGSPRLCPYPPEQLNSLPSLLTCLDRDLNAASEAGAAEGRELVKWFDHEDHRLYDVCADDHCQRYQGLTMAVGEDVKKAIDSTWGELLTYEGRICDARFSKCCGGVTEKFSVCWADEDRPYLQALPDSPQHSPEARPFCNTADKAILSRVLNNYDLETPDFYNWTESCSRAQISDIFRRKSGLDIGEIRDLIPLAVGKSGRIYRLRLVGTKGEITIGKELIIRNFLSESHLKSSAFAFSWEGDRLILRGRGWGHGVGLCQIGAAVMAEQGYSYSQILAHYYPGSTICRNHTAILPARDSGAVLKNALDSSSDAATEGQSDA